MGLTKSDIFTEQQNRLAGYAKALGSPARIAILELLLQRQSCICGDIVDELPLSQATISQHLKVLKECGLIQGNIEGPRVCYCIDPAAWQEAGRLLGNFLDQTPGAPKENCC